MTITRSLSEISIVLITGVYSSEPSNLTKYSPPTFLALPNINEGSLLSGTAAAILAKLFTMSLDKAISYHPHNFLVNTATSETVHPVLHSIC